MLYAFYSRGYKGGGANPPSPGFATKEEFIANAHADGVSEFQFTFWEMFNQLPTLSLTGVEYGKTFDPEFVNAFEIGAKNTLRSEEHTSGLQSLMRISYAVFCLKKKNHQNHKQKSKHKKTTNNNITIR